MFPRWLTRKTRSVNNRYVKIISPTLFILFSATNSHCRDNFSFFPHFPRVRGRIFPWFLSLHVFLRAMLIRARSRLSRPSPFFLNNLQFWNSSLFTNVTKKYILTAELYKFRENIATGTEKKCCNKKILFCQKSTRKNQSFVPNFRNRVFDTFRQSRAFPNLFIRRNSCL